MSDNIICINTAKVDNPNIHESKTVCKHCGKFTMIYFVFITIPRNSYPNWREKL